jgi:hypothetical protein
MAYDNEDLESLLARLRSGKEQHQHGSHRIIIPPGKAPTDYYHELADDLYDKYLKHETGLKQKHTLDKDDFIKSMSAVGYPEHHDKVAKHLKNMDDLHDSKLNNVWRDFNSKKESLRKNLGINPDIDKYKGVLKRFGTTGDFHGRLAAYGVGGSMAAYALYKYLKSKDDKDEN